VTALKLTLVFQVLEGSAHCHSACHEGEREKKCQKTVLPSALQQWIFSPKIRRVLCCHALCAIAIDMFDHPNLKHPAYALDCTQQGSMHKVKAFLLRRDVLCAFAIVVLGVTLGLALPKNEEVSSDAPHEHCAFCLI
jgi:hypothetical protein